MHSQLDALQDEVLHCHPAFFEVLAVRVGATADKEPCPAGSGAWLFDNFRHSFPAGRARNRQACCLQEFSATDGVLHGTLRINSVWTWGPETVERNLRPNRLTDDCTIL